MKQFSYTYLKRLGAGVAIALIILPFGIGIAPEKAGAQYIVSDILHTVQGTITAVSANSLSIKEYILDPLVTMIGRTVIQSLMRSIINWANNGFEGSPAFVTDLQRNLRNLGDRVAGAFIDELGIRGFINTPFRDVVLRELRISYRRITSEGAYFERSRFTLNQYSDDPDRFLRGDFSRGGIRAWVHSWMNSSNNPIGALNEARRELEGRIGRAISERTNELSWSNGILSWCGNASSAEASHEAQHGVDLGEAPRNGCDPGEQRRTPGSFIHERINRALNTDLNLLVTADEIDEMIGAVLQGLVNKMLSGSGFLGLSESSGGGGSSAADELGDPTRNGTVLTGTSSGVVDSQIDQLKRHGANWERIKAVAERAKGNCEERGDAEIMEEITAAIEEATAVIEETEVLVAELEAIKVKLAAGGGPDQIRLQREGAEEYQALLASGRLPTVSEISRGAQESQDNPGAEPPTLYTRMNELSRRPLCLF